MNNRLILNEYYFNKFIELDLYIIIIFIFLIKIIYKKKDDWIYESTHVHMDQIHTNLRKTFNIMRGLSSNLLFLLYLIKLIDHNIIIE